jgi:hypothetical protein
LKFKTICTYVGLRKKKFMLRAYYKLWVDAIIAQKTKRDRQSSWKAFTIVPISVMMGINLFTLLYWINVLTHHELPVILVVKFSSDTLINIFLSAILMFFVPFLLLNSLVIFYNNKFESLVKTYKANNGKWYRNYYLASIGGLVIPFALKWIF